MDFSWLNWLLISEAWTLHSEGCVSVSDTRRHSDTHVGVVSVVYNKLDTMSGLFRNFRNFKILISCEVEETCKIIYMYNSQQGHVGIHVKF